MEFLAITCWGIMHRRGSKGIANCHGRMPSVPFPHAAPSVLVILRAVERCKCSRGSGLGFVIELAEWPGPLRRVKNATKIHGYQDY